MEQSELLKILAVAGRLKRTTRHCWTEPDRKESVADHSWRIALMAMLLTPEFPGLDMQADIVQRHNLFTADFINLSQILYFNHFFTFKMRIIRF